MGRWYRWTGRSGRPAPRPREACSSGKLGWFSEAGAVLALHWAWRDHPHGDENGRHPRGVYRCAVDGCPSWHLTGQLQGARSDVSQTSK